MRERRPYELYVSRRRARIASIGFALVAGVLLAPTAASQETPKSGLRIIGMLPQPPHEDRLFGAQGGKIIGLDEEGRRLYYLYFNPRRGNDAFLREYGLEAKVPRLIRDVRVFSNEEFTPPTLVSPYTVAIARPRGQILMLNTSSEDRTRPYKVEIIERETLKAAEPINLVSTAPGFIPYGMTYSAQDDRLYMVGQVLGYPLNYAVNIHGTTPPPITAAAAIDMKTRRLAWLRVIPQCESPLTTYGIGSLVARSAREDVLYFGCIRPGPYPGESGVIRLRISPDADMAAAQGFRVELFPVSGLYTGGGGIVGIAAFDQATDRFYMQSVSQTTPGAWVFDGRISSWVGFVAAPDHFDEFIGFDQRTGRIYIGGEGEPPQRSAYIVVADGRGMPVPQGNTFIVPGSMKDMIQVDAATRRLFVTVDRSLGTNPKYDIFILEDASPLASPIEPLDYDDLTVDIDEGPSTAATYAGTINGYGSNVLLAGGYGGVLSICGGSLDGGLCPGGLLAAFYDQSLPPLPISADNTVAGVKPGDRALYMARVSSVDIRNVGASASAQTLAPDSLTSDEYETRFREAVSQGAGEAVGGANKEAGEELEQEIYDGLIWPHRGVACLDGGGRPFEEERSGPGGSSSISCDLKAHQASAVSRFGAFTAAGVSVASSSFEATALRDPKVGTVTESKAIAKGVEIEAPGGNVSIAEVRTTARTIANGRRGGSRATWERALSGVVVRDASGEITFQCSDADSCDPRQAIAAMNDALGIRIRAFLPEPEQVATPKGAFAGIRRTDADYFNALTVNNDNSRAVPGLEIIVFNDSVEKSRLIVQLAGIQASSIYGISFLPEPGSGDGSGGGVLPDVLPTGPLPTMPPGFSGPGPSVLPPSAGPVEKLIRSTLFFIRSPKDALLTGLLGLLFAGAGAAAWRRSTLVRQLRQGS